MSADLRLENHFNFNNMYMDLRPKIILTYFPKNESVFFNLLNYLWIIRVLLHLRQAIFSSLNIIRFSALHSGHTAANGVFIFL